MHLNKKLKTFTISKILAMPDANEFHLVLMRMLALIFSSATNRSNINQHRAFANFLNNFIPDKKHAEFTALFQEMMHSYESAGRMKKIGSNSVKLIRFCNEINQRFDRATRILLWLRLAELISDRQGEETETDDYLTLAADSLNIESESQQALRQLISDSTTTGKSDIRMQLPGMLSWHDAASGLLLAKFCDRGFLMNDHPIVVNTIAEIKPGMEIADNKGNSISYTMLMRQYCGLHAATIGVELNHVKYSYRNKTVLQPVSLTIEGPAVVALSGRSGSGKSTLLRLMAGTLRPETGVIRIYSEHGDTVKRGYVEQDEAFIAEFTVEEILHERLALLKKAGLVARHIGSEIVSEVAAKTGLTGQLHQKAGSHGQSQLSGGQRKKLAIALQLLTSPEVLLLDEPTSGLSSGDAIEMMTIVKNLAAQGCLVICSLHQPSFELLHQTDYLLQLDTGGFPVYYGETSGAAAYFRNISETADNRALACPACMHYNPADLFNIVEETRLDETGNRTGERKISPQQWYESFKSVHEHGNFSTKKATDKNKKQPCRMVALTLHFFARDVKRMIRKPSSSAAIFVSAAVLFLLIAFVSRGSAGDYNYSTNPNIPAAFLMMMITAVFTGMMVAGNEVCGDRNFRRSEKLISRDMASWVSSKLIRMLLVSVIMAMLMVSILSGMLAIPIGFWRLTLLMIAVFFHGAALGLLLSSVFRQLSTVYFVVPLIIVPQLLLSGLIINFDNFPRCLQSTSFTPPVADLAATRWAFEAIAVDAFVNNTWEKQFYTVHYQKYRAAWYLNHVIPYTELLAKKDRKAAQQLLQNEIKREKFRVNTATDFESQTALLKTVFSRLLHECINSEQTMQEQLAKVYDMNKMKQENHNQQLALLLVNPVPAFTVDNNQMRLVRRFAPVFYLPDNNAGRAHYFAPAKKIGNTYIDTFDFNLLIISVMNLLIIAGLYLINTRKRFS